MLENHTFDKKSEKLLVLRLAVLLNTRGTDVFNSELDKQTKHSSRGVSLSCPGQWLTGSENSGCQEITTDGHPKREIPCVENCTAYSFARISGMEIASGPSGETVNYREKINLTFRGWQGTTISMWMCVNRASGKRGGKCA
ncbi:hypothetical protein AVEN_87371-1 [Araneus ventricosus]|uniref:Uncharacterized protein n=1 Tax=Araneus ventricosus TaxID=182803 RepID=A0A4Y2X656_ARAVE|nr:hypothetical protein AVEN_87371-1 [Araneus ventricosus]